MCLYVDKGRTKPSQATRDITVFKIVSKNRGGKGKYISYYQGFEYEDGYEYTVNNFPLTVNHDFPGARIDGGAIHSYKLSGLANQRHQVFDKGHKIICIQCTIPKGAYYYRGTKNEIASSSLIIVRTITPYIYKKLLKK